jgi:GNAT superfamily N-acetyltransferase
MSDFPVILPYGGRSVTIRLYEDGDMAGVERFVHTVPVHDLLFLGRDIQHPKVLKAWADSIAEGDIISLVAWADGEVVGTSAIVRDMLGWSPHVAELRLLVAEDMRGLGLGRSLLHHSFTLAVDGEAEKLVARMTPDQKGAIAMFEEMGFRREALLVDHVRERDNSVHDLAVYSLNLGRIGASHGADGFEHVYPKGLQDD